jgi:NAD(P)-dependent dehydrogenase (short-subunit alcohol dehydrogenase family)
MLSRPAAERAQKKTLSPRQAPTQSIARPTSSRAFPLSLPLTSRPPSLPPPPITARNSAPEHEPLFPTKAGSAAALHGGWQEDGGWVLAGGRGSERGAWGLDRAVVITGVSKGIGAATARVLAAKGCHVFGSVRKAGDAAALVADLGPLFTPLVFDVTDAAAVAAGASHVAAALGPARCLWGLVNNAGIHAGSDPVAYLEPALLRAQLEVNLVAPVVVAQAFLPLLGMDRARAGPPGRICMMSSVYGNYGIPWMVRGGRGGCGSARECWWCVCAQLFSSACPVPFSLLSHPHSPLPSHLQGAYCASKFALEGLTQSLRRELTPFGIDAVTIRPGPVSSEIWDASMHGGAEYWSKYDDTDYKAAMAKSRRMLERETANPAWFLPCEAVGRCVWAALSAAPRAGPTARVVTPNWFENWCAPVWFPARLVDKVVAAKFGLLRVLGRGAEVGGGGGGGGGGAKAD